MPSAIAAATQPASNANMSCVTEHNTSGGDDGLAVFLSVRARLFAIAYRMLGSAAEAEDVVQDVWLRWHTADRTAVRDAGAFLAKTTTRLAINVMHSARVRRETSVESWQSEPADTSGDPRLAIERDQALASGVRMLLEKLTPTERAAYILREAFDYAYRDIASALQLAEANARQVVTRARQHIVSDRMTATTSEEHERLLDAFIAAADDDDAGALEEFFASAIGATLPTFVHAA